jgi:hypothetical protein
MTTKLTRSNSEPNIPLSMFDLNNRTENLDATRFSAAIASFLQNNAEPPQEILERLNANLNLHPIKPLNSKRPASDFSNDYLNVIYPPPLTKILTKSIPTISKLSCALINLQDKLRNQL